MTGPLSTHPILKSIKNQDLLDLASKPKLLCEKFNVPMVFVEGVKSKKIGRFTEFEYDGKPYKRVELVAKAFYEKKGLEVSWSEGAALVLVNAAINSAISRRLVDSFKVADSEQYVGVAAKTGLDERSKEVRTQSYEEQLREYEKLSFGTYKLVRHCIAMERRDRRKLIDALVSDIDQVDQGGSIDELNIAPFLKVVDSIEAISAKASKIQDSLMHSDLNEELIVHMNEFIEHDKRRMENNRTKVYSNYNEWSMAFALRIIELLGIGHFQNRFEESLTDNSSLMSSFDLTMLDTERKALRFAEVKNTDGLTPFQLLYLEEWINLPSNNRPEFEFCFVQPD